MTHLLMKSPEAISGITTGCLERKGLEILDPKPSRGNSKSQFLNPKQYQMTKIQWTRRFLNLEFRNSNLFGPALSEVEGIGAWNLGFGAERPWDLESGSTIAMPRRAGACNHRDGDSGK
jgi:hypothetical protein